MGSRVPDDVEPVLAGGLNRLHLGAIMEFTLQIDEVARMATTARSEPKRSSPVVVVSTCWVLEVPERCRVMLMDTIDFLTRLQSDWCRTLSNHAVPGEVDSTPGSTNETNVSSFGDSCTSRGNAKFGVDMRQMRLDGRF